MSDQTLLIRRYEETAPVSERVSKAVLELLHARMQLPDAGGRSVPSLEVSYQAIRSTVGEIAASKTELMVMSPVPEIRRWIEQTPSTADQLGGVSELTTLAEHVQRPFDEWTSDDFDLLMRFAATLDAYVTTLYAQLPVPGARRSTNG